MKRRNYIPDAYTEEYILAAVQAAVPQGGAIEYLFQTILTEAITGRDEFERGKCEGRRELAGQLLAMAKPASESGHQVKKNVEST